MKKFVVEPSVWELFPGCEIGVLLLRDIKNTEEDNQRLGKPLRSFYRKPRKMPENI